MVVKLCHADVGKHGQPTPHVVLVPLDAPQQAHAAKDALREGAHHNLGDGVGEDAHAEEGAEDGPVELVEQGQLGPALHHEAAIGEPDEDDAEEEVEEEGVDVDVDHHLPHHQQQLAPQQPLILVLLGGKYLHGEFYQEEPPADQLYTCKALRFHFKQAYWSTC